LVASFVTTAALIAAKLVDDFHLFVHPIILGGGNPWLPQDVRMPLELVVEHRLGCVVHVHHRGS
jgi:dihydrofolate reductase